MMIDGDKVEFKRSNGKWTVGFLIERIGDYYIVEWLCNDGFIGRKKVHHLYVRKTSNIRIYFLIGLNRKHVHIAVLLAILLLYFQIGRHSHISLHFIRLLVRGWLGLKGGY